MKNNKKKEESKFFVFWFLFIALLPLRVSA